MGCQARMKNPTGYGTVAGCPPPRRRLPGTAAILLRLEREILCGPLRVLPSAPAQGNAQEGDELVHSSPVSSDQPSLLAGRTCSWPSPRVLVTTLPYGIRLMGRVELGLRLAPKQSRPLYLTAPLSQWPQPLPIVQVVPRFQRSKGAALSHTHTLAVLCRY